MAVYIRGTDEERFWPKVGRKGKNDCWLWQAGGGSYGAFKSQTTGLKRAHAFACYLGTGRLPKAGEVARHSCDVKRCCNPAHLSWGSQAQNLEDARKRGRYNCGRGERAGGAKLRLDQVNAIRADKKSSVRTLALKYKMSYSAIAAIRNGTSWKID